MERKIGEIFEYNGEWYQCGEGRCRDCYFSEKRYLCKQFITKGFCISGIIFKRLEKVGEPYEFDGHLFQSYRTFEVPIFTENYATVRELGNNSKISIEIKQTNEDMEEKNNGNTPLNVLTDKYVNGDICYDGFEKEVKALYSCKEEIKPTLKEFDLEAAKAGKPICTRDGSKARIICFDRKGYNMFPIVALIMNGDRESDIYTYRPNGTWDNSGNESDKDLMMLPEKKEGWINIIKTEDGGYCCKCEVHSDYNDAINENINVLDKRGITVKIEWYE